MIKKSIIIKISIFVELSGFYEPVMSSDDVSESADIQELVDSINLVFVDSLDKLGFKPISRIPRHTSCRNGGYALYTTFELVEGCIKFKLIFDTRVADHRSKNLPAKNEVRREGLADLYPEIKEGNAECSVIDSYVESQQGDLSIFIGSKTYPSRPCRSMNQANALFIDKVKSLVLSQIDEYVTSALAPYSSETIEFVEEFLNDSANLSTYELEGDSWVCTPNEQDIKELRLEYLEAGSDEGLIESTSQFDKLCEILSLARKYSS